MSDELTVVLAGCGGMSRRWLSVAGEIEELKVTGLVDLREESARQRQADFELTEAMVSDNLETVLSATQPDIVFDCAVPEAHHPITMTALAHGCHVLGEKPLADSMDHAREMVAGAEQAGKLFAVIQNRRYDPNIRRLRNYLASGAIGQVTTVNSDFYIGAHFGGFRDHMEHVLLLDMAIHTFDQARLLTGANARSVFCKEWNPAGSWYDHDASAMCLFEMTDDIVYNYRGSWCAEGHNTSWECDWRIVGERGTVIWNGGEQMSAEVARAPGGFKSELETVDIPPAGADEKRGGHEGIIREFVDCVRHGGEPETAAADNIHSLAMVFGAIESAERSQVIAID